MFAIHDTKAFRDVVHGYINIPKLFVEHIIDTPEFQRLHFVDQTGMRPVYPGAKHTRFIHSLGVYHLGLRAVDALLDNFKENAHWHIRSDDSLYTFWAKNKVLFLLACLLHDVGHAPYSHSMEAFFVEGDNGEDLYRELAAALGLSPESGEYAAMKKAQPHEQISALMTFQVFRDPIGEILDSLGQSGYPEVQGTPLRLDRSELDEDLRFIARMILGLKFVDYQPEYQIRNCFIEMLNGTNFDVDKLDYIIRDTQMSGISNITLDMERLLSALTIVPVTNYQDFDFQKPFVTSSAVFLLDLVQVKDAALRLKGTVDVPLQLRQQKVVLRPGVKFSMRGSDQGGDGGMIGAALRLSGHASFSGDSRIQQLRNEEYKLCKPDPNSHDIRLPYSEDENTCIIQSATVIDDDFSFTVQSKGAALTLEDRADLQLTALEAPANAILSSAHFSGEIQGKVKLLRILEDQLHGMSPAKNAYISFALGFKKQAVNIITNVMDARDYLYLWIYAHHKVVYYANYLVVELPRLAQAVLCEGTSSVPRLSEQFNCQRFIEAGLDEADIISLIRQAYRVHKRWQKGPRRRVPSSESKKLHRRFETLYQEFFSRKYKKSVYKSLAEYDLFFRDFTPTEKSALRQQLPHETEMAPVEGYKRNPKYGVWTQEALKKNGITALEWLVWVDASYSRKILDMSRVYICFRQDVLNVERIPIVRKEYDNITNSVNYFYLYYQPKASEDEGEVVSQLKAYFRRLVDQKRS